MTIGLTNAPAPFQSTLDKILAEQKWQSCLVYPNDGTFFLKNIEFHYAYVGKILNCRVRTDSVIKLKTCDVFTDTGHYFEHVIKPGELAIEETTDAALKKEQQPKNQKELRSFLRMCNVYRRFARGYFNVAMSLEKFSRKEHFCKLIAFDEEQESAFQTLNTK